MKEPIELNISQLEAIASNQEVRIPDGLEKELAATVNALDWLEREDSTESIRPEAKGIRSPRFRRILGIAASAAILIGSGFGIYDYSSRPKDTFDDPYLAYQQLEEAFALISSKVEKSADMAGEAHDIFVETNRILNNTLN